jgi:hypothetical protein
VLELPKQVTKVWLAQRSDDELLGLERLLAGEVRAYLDGAFPLNQGGVTLRPGTPSSLRTSFARHARVCDELVARRADDPRLRRGFLDVRLPELPPLPSRDWAEALTDQELLALDEVLAAWMPKLRRQISLIYETQPPGPERYKLVHLREEHEYRVGVFLWILGLERMRRLHLVEGEIAEEADPEMLTALSTSDLLGAARVLRETSDALWRSFDYDTEQIVRTLVWTAELERGSAHLALQLEFRRDDLRKATAKHRTLAQRCDRLSTLEKTVAALLKPRGCEIGSWTSWPHWLPTLADYLDGQADAMVLAWAGHQGCLFKEADQLKAEMRRREAARHAAEVAAAVATWSHETVTLIEVPKCPSDAPSRATGSLGVRLLVQQAPIEDPARAVFSLVRHVLAGMLSALVRAGAVGESECAGLTVRSLACRYPLRAVVHDRTRRYPFWDSADYSLDDALGDALADLLSDDSAGVSGLAPGREPIEFGVSLEYALHDALRRGEPSVVHAFSSLIRNGFGVEFAEQRSALFGSDSTVRAPAHRPAGRRHWRARPTRHTPRQRGRFTKTRRPRDRSS